MARPKSEDKKQALLEAATAAFAQSGIAASTSAIARSAAFFGVKAMLSGRGDEVKMLLRNNFWR